MSTSPVRRRRRGKKVFCRHNVLRPARCLDCQEALLQRQARQPRPVLDTRRPDYHYQIPRWLGTAPGVTFYVLGLPGYGMTAITPTEVWDD